MNKDPKEELIKTYQSGLKEAKVKAEKIDLTYDASEDYEESRQLLKRLICRSEEALDTLLTLTQDSEHPRAYEVLSGLLKTTGDLADQLISLQKKRHELDYLNNPEKKQMNSGVTNNNLFVGSTTDLQRFLIGQFNSKKEKTIDADVSDR
jgi:CHASE3 domain sensor protein